MRNFAVFGPQQSTGKNSQTKVRLEGVPVDCRIVETPDPEFDPNAPPNLSMVLVRKRAFSLNYRDRSFVIGTSLNAPPDRYAVLGSEFTGEVLACGPEARGLKPGDRVIADNAFPESGVPGLPGGIPGNMLSKELQVIHAAKLVRIPDNMTDEEAAGFSIGAQTTFSMARKLALLPGDAVLVTGGRSNTSLFAINTLKAYGFDPQLEIYASTTSDCSAQRLRELGVADIVRVDPDNPSFSEDPVVQRVVRERGGFDAVIDPFYDIHLIPAVPVMKNGGRYTTCGLYDQVGHLLQRPQRTPPQVRGVMSQIMIKNQQIIGNCLGQTSDLERALAAYAAGRLPVIIDSVFSNDDAAGFLDRTYNSPDRFGKVIYQYD